EVRNQGRPRATGRAGLDRPPRDRRVHLMEGLLRFLVRRVDAEVVDGAGAEGGVAGPREHLVAGGVVLDPAAAPEAALEVTRGTRAGVEHRPEAVPVGERVVRGPFVFKQVPPGGEVGRTRGPA